MERIGNIYLFLVYSLGRFLVYFGKKQWVILVGICDGEKNPILPRAPARTCPGEVSAYQTPSNMHRFLIIIYRHKLTNCSAEDINNEISFCYKVMVGFFSSFLISKWFLYFLKKFVLSSGETEGHRSS